MTLTWRWVGGRLYDVGVESDGAITFTSVPDRRPR